ncbi:MAG: putative porin [Desulfobulbaceae bacterium]|nr:putative porin [Desulfobulbaceae bacterium]
MKKKYLLAACMAVSVLVFNAAGSFAADASNSFDSIEALIEILRDKGIVTDDEASRFINRHHEKTIGKESSKTEPERTITIVSPEKEQRYIDEITQNVAAKIGDKVEKRVDERLKKQLEQAEYEHQVGSAAGWAQRIRFGGDMRLRYQGDYFDKENAVFVDPSDPTEIIDQEERHRGRIRVRVSAKAKVTDTVDATVRLSTGNEKDPVSTNDTFGDYSNKDSVVFDRIFVKWHPSDEFTAWGGRIPNPWLHTDLVWDGDLNFEGAAATYEPKFTNWLQGFLTAGIFSIDEFSETTEDKFLWAGQTGLTFTPTDTVKFKLGVAYYDYENIQSDYDPLEGAPNTAFTAPRFIQKGNTLFYIDPSEETVGLASGYEEVSVTAKLDISIFDPVTISLYGDYVKNIGFDEDDVAARVLGTDNGDPDNLIEEETEGYLVGLRVGHEKMKEFADWSVFCNYRYLEADAVLDAFSDSDFHLGGTNAKGWMFGGQFGLMRSVWLQSRWISTDEISGPPFTIDTLQVDLNVKY